MQEYTGRCGSDPIHKHARAVLGLLGGERGGLARGAVGGRAALPAAVRGVRARPPHDRGGALRGLLHPATVAATPATGRC